MRGPAKNADSVSANRQRAGGSGCGHGRGAAPPKYNLWAKLYLMCILGWVLWRKCNVTSRYKYYHNKDQGSQRRLHRSKHASLTGNPSRGAITDDQHLLWQETASATWKVGAAAFLVSVHF